MVQRSENKIADGVGFLTTEPHERVGGRICIFAILDFCIIFENARGGVGGGRENTNLSHCATFLYSLRLLI